MLFTSRRYHILMADQDLDEADNIDTDENSMNVDYSEVAEENDPNQPYEPL